MKKFEEEMKNELKDVEGVDLTAIVPEGAVDAATEQLKSLKEDFKKNLDKRNKDIAKEKLADLGRVEMPKCARGSSCRKPENLEDKLEGLDEMPESVKNLLKDDKGEARPLKDIPAEELEKPENAALKTAIVDAAAAKYGNLPTKDADGNTLSEEEIAAEKAKFAEKFSPRELASLEEVSVPALDKLPTEVKDKLEDPANVKMPNGKSYVSKINVCRAPSGEGNPEQITGVKVTFKDSATKVEVTEMEGSKDGAGNIREMDCSDTEGAIELEENDCITRLNIAFDDTGSGHSLVYRRRQGTAEETKGLKKNFRAEDVTNDDVPATGCLSGYNLGFGAPATTPTVSASRALSAMHPTVGTGIWETLMGMITISSGALDEQLAEAELTALIS